MSRRNYHSREERRALGLCALCGARSEHYRCAPCYERKRPLANSRRGDNRKALSAQRLAVFHAVYEQHGAVTGELLAQACGITVSQASNWLCNAEFRDQVVRVKRGKYAPASHAQEATA